MGGVNSGMGAAKCIVGGVSSGMGGAKFILGGVYCSVRGVNCSIGEFNYGACNMERGVFDHFVGTID